MLAFYLKASIAKLRDRQKSLSSHVCSLTFVPVTLKVVVPGLPLGNLRNLRDIHTTSAVSQSASLVQLQHSPEIVKVSLTAKMHYCLVAFSILEYS